MGGELVGEATHLAAAHGVGLPRQRERTHAGTADASRGEVAIDDGVDLVGALCRLVDALAIEGDDPLRSPEQIEEVTDVRGVEPCRGGSRRRAWRDEPSARERLDKILCMARDIVVIDGPDLVEVNEKA
jgi:hypothetical protein